MSTFIRRAFNKIRPISLADAATSVRVVAPAIELTAAPSFYLPGEFEAVLNCVNGDLPLELRRVTGASNHHLPTIEYTLKNAVIDDDAIYAGRFFDRYETNRPLRSHQTVDEPTHLPEAVLSSNCLSGREFGHWVRDSLVTEMHGLEVSLPSIGLVREPWPHEAEYRALSKLDCAYPRRCRIDRLVVLDDRGHNEDWKRRFIRLRRKVSEESASGSDKPSGGSMIFLSRGLDGRIREPSNIEDVEAALHGIGFKSINPSAMSVGDIANSLRDAKIVVGTEGSNLNHLHYFAPDGVALVCMQDPNRFYSYHKSLMDCYDGKFGFVVGRPDPDIPGRHRVNIEDIRRTIDLML